MKLSSLLNKLLAPAGLAIIRRDMMSSTAISPPAPDINAALKEAQRELLRSQISARWSTIDFLLRKRPDDAATRVCPLCGHEASDVKFRQLRSHCIFGGGDLLRHVCPSCEVIYGPDKMFELTAAELAEDYEWHYKVYEEGDSTERELRTFFSLNPNKDGVYLNYGAGGWSNSVQQLRAQGWNVHAYEPHNSATSSGKHDWLIGSADQLRLMRFDGIFSNNVLEHFRHPVQELQNMSRLLREGGNMAHATPCFEYLYEYTRFHLFFFPGKSKDMLLQKAGLKLIEEIVDGDFICQVSVPTAKNEQHV